MYHQMTKSQAIIQTKKYQLRQKQDIGMHM